mgnify:CR=1 FL=1
MRSSFLLFALALFSAASASGELATTPAFWPDKSGPTFDCVVPAADAAKIPTEWDGESGKNIAWSVELEGLGHSSPVIGGDLVWFTAATEDGTKQYVYAINRHDGTIVHHKLMFSNPDPEPLGNPLNNYAAPSPVLEDGAVYVHFGTYGTARLDPATGEKVWERRDINVRHFRGPGSSPVIFENLLLLSFDGIDKQFVTALDKETGATIWKTNRTTDYGDLDPDGNPTRDGDMRKAYHTPSVFEIAGRQQMISVGSRAAFGYDVHTGEELWTIRHGGFNAAIRPLRSGDLLFLNTGSERSHTLAVRIDDQMKGDITESHIVWDREKRNASEASPVIVDGMLIQITRGGIVSCNDVKTGDEIWEERLPGQFLPAPIVSGDRLYFSNDRGETHLVRAAKTWEVLGMNQLPSPISSSPAVAEGAIFLRTKTHLHKIVGE